MKSKNLNLFYIHQAFFQFSESMLALVLPIFIYQLFDSISIVFLFALIWNIIYFILFIPVFNLAMRSGKPNYFMGLGVIFYFLALISFSKTTPDSLFMIIPATLFFSLYITFYWMVRHWFFSMNSDHKKIGKQVSLMGVISVLIGFASPLIAGWLSFFVSFNITFILGGVAVALSLIPVLLFHAPPHPRAYDLAKIKIILKKPALRAIRSAYIWEGISDPLGLKAWGLAFFIFVGNIMDLGNLIGFAVLISAVLMGLAGHWFDRRKRVKLFTRFTYIRALAVFMYSTIFFYPHLIYVWGVELFHRFTVNVHHTFADAYLYALSSKIHPIHFHLNREIHLIIARILANGCMAAAFYFLPAEFLWVSIALAGFMMLGWLSLRKADHLLH